jgi:phage tail protein X
VSGVNIAMAEEYWEVPTNIDTNSFDFNWRPDVFDSPYFYQFGTQHHKTSGPRYVVPGARRVKYIDEQVARAIPDMSKWIIKPDIEVTNFDFSWHPCPMAEPYNYVFGDQFKTPEEFHTITYITDINFPTKYMTNMTATIKWRPLDIIFVSNGEIGAEARYARLAQLAGREVKWVKGINSREAAIKQAARISSTQWFILFPGKLWADENFDFDFQPNRYIEPKHYIFYASNPLNGLEYGHQAAVCYNRQLVLDTIDYGLDFTMSATHDIVPVTSGIAQYNSSILMTWRTAFREAIKLAADNDSDSLDRLAVWKSYARGQYCEWSIIGANDGIEYYNNVAGEHTELMKSFDWQWLTSYFVAKYGEIK